MNKIFSLLFIIITLLSCNKIEKMKNKIAPENPYLKANIDKFYWQTVSDDHNIVPLIKPYQLMKITGSNEWYLPTKSNDSFNFKNGSIVKLNSFSTVVNCNIFPPYVFGIDEEVTTISPETNKSIIIKPRLYFIINTDNNNLDTFEDYKFFKERLNQLNLPNEYSTPDYLFEQFRDNPVLPWFPEEIKKQLEEVKKQKGN